MTQSLPDYWKDLYWCPVCGRHVPWKHDRQPTLKARVAKVLIHLAWRLESAAARWRDSAKAPYAPIYDANAKGGHDR